MKSPISYRHKIPFYYDKSKVEFQKDIYERYHEMVLKHNALHLADKLWGQYPMQSILDFGREYIKSIKPKNILEVGCGVGRWIADLASSHPQSVCWGIDYSYQMLKQANDFWIKSKDLDLDMSHKGFNKMLHVPGSSLAKINFGLAKVSELPFDDHSQDFVCSSFLIDRLADPAAGMLEMIRVLKPNGILVIITPLNFENADHWDSFYPTEKLSQFLIELGLELLEWKKEMHIEEPLDARGNCVMWKCLGVVANKK